MSCEPLACGSGPGLRCPPAPSAGAGCVHEKIWCSARQLQATAPHRPGTALAVGPILASPILAGKKRGASEGARPGRGSAGEGIGRGDRPGEIGRSSGRGRSPELGRGCAARAKADRGRRCGPACSSNDGPETEGAPASRIAARAFGAGWQGWRRVMLPRCEVQFQKHDVRSKLAARWRPLR